MSFAYKDVSPKRNLRVLVNPKGGPGKASEIFTSVVQPIFRAARSNCEVTYTERSKHAMDIAKTLPLDTYDAIVTLSGDGLIHEVFSGFAEHPESVKAFSTPICPVPTGSGNGTSLNLLGLKEGFDVGVATLNAIKGKPMRHDICAVILGERRILSFMTVALGLMADLDLGTEHLRWLGDGRFMYGFLRGLIRLKPCPVTLSIKVAESNKEKMARAAQDFNVNIKSSRNDYSAPANDGQASGEQSSADATDEWLTLDKPILYLFTGKSPYVARDLMQFPVARASDGFIDVVAQEVTSRGELLSSIDGGPKGAAYWKDFQHYFKATSYRITPNTPDHEKQNLAIDGERYPFGPFEVEIEQGLASFLSPYGAFVDEFNVPPPSQNKTNEAAGAKEPVLKPLKKLTCLESS
ncbi:hypothetical protein SCHPADRAFT_874023 [Schizopora paradoxa]|uniref:DAGKc domain-containing protein n=1 Tax=Schizopora paradoxa TaxID=27342 RepID=A0A0H2RNW4_9AGAM|nr:hypothetical protein SCHPADRAFT_874023 [Schizopora paradoxa]